MTGLESTSARASESVGAPAPRGPYADWGKRTLDLTVATLLLLVAAPFALGAAIAVGMAMGRPLLFRQLRPGLHGRPFTLLKFRTMAAAAAGVDALRAVSSDAQRLTGVGRVLRRTSLDEIPQLWNVLRGDMSLVGPRPLLMEYLPLYTPEQMRRHDVRPGITGLAQVSGRNALTWEARFALDVQYVRSLSLVQDVRILLRTAGRVLRSEGVSAPGQATMSVFTGSRRDDA